MSQYYSNIDVSKNGRFNQNVKPTRILVDPEKPRNKFFLKRGKKIGISFSDTRNQHETIDEAINYYNKGIDKSIDELENMIKFQQKAIERLQKEKISLDDYIVD